MASYKTWWAPGSDTSADVQVFLCGPCPETPSVCVRYETLTAATVKSINVLGVTPYNLVDIYRCSEVGTASIFRVWLYD
jgi:hypothetical protein